MAELRALLRIRPFRRLWLVLGLSSLGDWVGLLATTTFAASLFSSTAAKSVAFGSVIVVRLLPALVLGPIAGVVADRWDRRYTIVVTDVMRFLLYASIPAASLLTTDSKLVVAWATVATFIIEACGMVWAPAKDAAVPNLIPRARMEIANQLTLAATYGITPVAAGLLMALLNKGLSAVGPAAIATASVTKIGASVALYFDALTFLASAVVVLFGIRELSGRSRLPHEKRPSMLRQFISGWSYVAKTPLVRGLVLGILGAFAAAGLIIGSATSYATSLGAGANTYYILFAMIFIGLGIGIVAGPRMVNALSRRRWFGLSIIMAAFSVALLAVSPHLALSVVVTLFVGLGGGMAFLAGTTLIGTEVDDSVRGRVFAFIQTAVRVALILTIALTSVIVGLGGSRKVSIGSFSMHVSSTRMLLLVAGVFGAFAGYAALRDMDDKRGVPLWADVIGSIRGRPLGLPEAGRGRGLFIVFEGGEGAGKSTQARLLAERLMARGHDVVVTREPGATDIGVEIRHLVLDHTHDAGPPLSARAEALLYAADRADHVARVVRPALARGSVVISDRYVDSSLAYQGAGRTLPINEVSWLSRWATGGLKPDLVVLLDIDPRVGLARVAGRSAADRLEVEPTEFHERVRYAFLDLAADEPGRYLVLDASRPAEDLAERIAERLEILLPPGAPAVGGPGAHARPDRHGDGAPDGNRAPGGRHTAPDPAGRTGEDTGSDGPGGSDGRAVLDGRRLSDGHAVYGRHGDLHTMETRRG